MQRKTSLREVIFVSACTPLFPSNAARLCLPEFHILSREVTVSCLHQDLYAMTGLLNKNSQAVRTPDGWQLSLPSH